MPSYLITGASRGIGLAAVQKLLEDPKNFVIATARNPSGSKGLQALLAKYPKDRLSSLVLDISNPASVDKAAADASALLPGGLDYLISNAGISLQPLATFENIDLKTFEEELRINTVSPVHLVRAFLPLVRKGNEKKIMFTTSELGSIQMASLLSTVSITYSVTKAALNMLARKWGAELYKEGIATVLIHPGWVDTEMGSTIDDWVAEHFPHLKKISVEESLTGVLKVLAEAKPESEVKFRNYDGTEKPW